MSELQNSFQGGFRFFTEEAGVSAAAEYSRLTNGEYLASIQKEIDKFTEAMNQYSGNGNPQLKGFIAETWHTYTFNIEAAAKRSSSRVYQDCSNKLGSVDISTNWGDEYSLKYYNTGEKSAIAQSHPLEWAYQRYVSKLSKEEASPTREEFLARNGIDPKTDMTLGMYEGQARLIPSDQIEDAIHALNKKILKELNNLDNPDRKAVAERLIEVRNKLVAHIESPDGVTSLNLTEPDSKVLAELVKIGKFDPKNFDITLAKKADLYFLSKNVLKAGLNAAWIAALLKIVPEIINSLKKLLQEGYLDAEDLQNIGKAGFSGAKDGFLSGFFFAAIDTAAKAGFLGKFMKKAAESAHFAPIVGTIIVLLREIIPNSIQYAQGKISASEYAIQLERDLTIAAGSLIGGSVLVSIFPQATVISYMFGSLIGSILGGLVFSVKEHVMISLCIKHGYTFFGLVEQDYTMPKEVREKLGFPIFGIEDYPYTKYQFKEYHFKQYPWQEYKWQSFDCILLKRGIIGCRKIGYV